MLFYRLKSQIPEIKQTLEILKHMQKKKVSTGSPWLTTTYGPRISVGKQGDF